MPNKHIFLDFPPCGAIAGAICAQTLTARSVVKSALPVESRKIRASPELSEERSQIDMEPQVNHPLCLRPPDVRAICCLISSVGNPPPRHV